MLLLLYLSLTSPLCFIKMYRCHGCIICVGRSVGSQRHLSSV